MGDAMLGTYVPPKKSEYKVSVPPIAPAPNPPLPPAGTPPEKPVPGTSTTDYSIKANGTIPPVKEMEYDFSNIFPKSLIDMFRASNAKVLGIPLAGGKATPMGLTVEAYSSGGKQPQVSSSSSGSSTDSSVVIKKETEIIANPDGNAGKIDPKTFSKMTYGTREINTSDIKNIITDTASSTSKTTTTETGFGFKFGSSLLEMAIGATKIKLTGSFTAEQTSTKTVTENDSQTDHVNTNYAHVTFDNHNDAIDTLEIQQGSSSNDNPGSKITRLKDKSNTESSAVNAGVCLDLTVEQNLTGLSFNGIMPFIAGGGSLSLSSKDGMQVKANCLGKIGLTNNNGNQAYLSISGNPLTGEKNVGVGLSLPFSIPAFSMPPLGSGSGSFPLSFEAFNSFVPTKTKTDTTDSFTDNSSSALKKTVELNTFTDVPDKMDKNGLKAVVKSSSTIGIDKTKTSDTATSVTTTVKEAGSGFGLSLGTQTMTSGDTTFTFGASASIEARTRETTTVTDDTTTKVQVTKASNKEENHYKPYDSSTTDKGQDNGTESATDKKSTTSNAVQGGITLDAKIMQKFPGLTAFGLTPFASGVGRIGVSANTFGEKGLNVTVGGQLGLVSQNGTQGYVGLEQNMINGETKTSAGFTLPI